MLAFYREGRQAEALRSYQRQGDPGGRAGHRPLPGARQASPTRPAAGSRTGSAGRALRGYRLLEKIDADRPGRLPGLQPRVERDVAVKIFHEAIAVDPEFVRRFDADAQAVAALEHPHIAPIYDYWREPSRAYVVSRYVRGGSLRAIEERGPLDRESLARHRADRSRADVRPPPGPGARKRRSVQDPLRSRGNAYLGDFRVGGLPPDPAEDVRALAHLARRLLPKEASRACRASGGCDRRTVGGGLATGAARHSSPQRSPLLGASKNETPTRASGRLLRPTPAISSGGRRSFGALAPGCAGPGRGSWQLSARAGAEVVRRPRRPGSGDPGRRLGGREDPFVVEMFPGEHPIDELEAALLRIAVHPVPRLRERLDSGSRPLGRRSRGPRRGGGRDRCRPVRRGLHAHDRPARAGTLPGVASRGRRDPRVGFA